MKKLKVGIFGGSFNPVHNGHLVLAEKAQAKFGFDELLFVPCYQAPHRQGKEVIASKHRVAMLKLALKECDEAVLSLEEVKRKGVSYTIETLKRLKKLYPKGTQFFFVIGSDLLHQLKTWKQISQLKKMCWFVVFNRKGFVLPRTQKVEGVSGLKWSALRIAPIEISSTQIREKVRRGKSILKEVPVEVAAYIKKERLYK